MSDRRRFDPSLLMLAAITLAQVPQVIRLRQTLAALERRAAMRVVPIHTAGPWDDGPSYDE
jgi:hypothetical protein